MLGSAFATRAHQVAARSADNGSMATQKSILRWDAQPETREGAPGEAPRRGTASDAEIVLPGRGLQYTGHIASLNAQGCLLETKCRLEPGTAVEVWLRTESMPLRLAARLIERSERGVKFVFQPMPVRKQEQVEMLRAELGLA
jgi:hypothetical protein